MANRLEPTVRCQKHLAMFAQRMNLLDTKDGTPTSFAEDVLDVDILGKNDRNGKFSEMETRYALINLRDQAYPQRHIRKAIQRRKVENGFVFNGLELGILGKYCWNHKSECEDRISKGLILVCVCDHLGKEVLIRAKVNGMSDWVNIILRPNRRNRDKAKTRRLKKKVGTIIQQTAQNTKSSERFVTDFGVTQTISGPGSEHGGLEF